MMVRLRPHHLLCMLTFSGRGYTPAFSENFRNILALISNGADIVLVSGPDDICKPMLCGSEETHCYNQSVADRDHKALRVIRDRLIPDLSLGVAFRLDGTAISQLRVEFKSPSIRNACHGCQWFDFCTEIANDEYAGSVL